MMQLNPNTAMANEPGKHFRLFFMLMITALGVLAALVLLFLLMRLVFGVLTFLPWLEYLYVVFLISVPAAIFITAFGIFFRRTLHHPAKVVRAISLVLISMYLLAWAVFFIWDVVTFIRFQYTDISYFRSYNMLFLFSNIAGLFFLGVAQALSLPPEKDWMDRRRHND